MQTEIFVAEANPQAAAYVDAVEPLSIDMTAMPPAARAAVALGSTATEQHLRELVVKSVAITTVVDVNGRAEAHSSYMALRTARTSITNTGKAAREDAQAFASAVIQEEKRLIDITKTEEDRVKALRDKFDAEEEAKAEALRVKQAARKAELQGKVDAIRNIPLGMAEASAADISIEIGSLREFVPEIETFFEFAADAQDAANAAVVALMTMLDRAVARELEEAKHERQRVEAARIAKEAAEREAAALAERQAAAARAEQELADRMRVIADQQRALDEQAAAIAKQRADADAALAVERAQFEAERKAFADQQAAAQQAKDDAAKLEADHAEALAINAAGHYYSTTTFREDGAPIMCNPDGTRNVFCDVDEDYGDDAAVAALIEPEPVVPVTADLDQTVIGLPVDSHDANEVLAIAPDAPCADVAAEVVAPTPPTMRLGQIGIRLGFVVTEQFLSLLGFPVAAKDKNACLYHESDYPHICRAIIRHIESKIADAGAA